MDELRGFLNVKTAHDAAIHSICLVVKSNIASVGTKQSRTEALEHITCNFFFDLYYTEYSQLVARFFTYSLILTTRTLIPITS